MSAWPEDILFIRYAELGSSLEERLHLLSLIGLLLNKSPGSYTSENLRLKKDDWNALCGWIERGNGSYFWQLEPLYLKIRYKCEKHILIDTSRLVADISNASQKKSSSMHPTINEVWLMARHYVQNEVELEMDYARDDR